jgi:hypothetical protein
MTRWIKIGVWMVIGVISAAHSAIADADCGQFALWRGFNLLEKFSFRGRETAPSERTISVGLPTGASTSSASDGLSLLD